LADAQVAGQPESPVTEDRVSNILKWVLLATAIICFGLLGWATVLTYEQAPPFPDRFVDSSGAVVMTADDIVAGKGGFQKADLMDYGSIYGMGSYFGEDYTASTLVRLGALTKQGLANSAAPPPGTKAPANQSLAVSGPATPASPTTPPATSLTQALMDATVTADQSSQADDKSPAPESKSATIGTRPSSGPPTRTNGKSTRPTLPPGAVSRPPA